MQQGLRNPVAESDPPASSDANFTDDLVYGKRYRLHKPKSARVVGTGERIDLPVGTPVYGIARYQRTFRSMYEVECLNREGLRVKVEINSKNGLLPDSENSDEWTLFGSQPVLNLRTRGRELKAWRNAAPAAERKERRALVAQIRKNKLVTEYSNYSTLTSLPPGVHAYELVRLEISNCTALRQLSEDLYVDCYLRVVNCPNLRKLSNRLAVSGCADLRDLPALAQLPEGFHVDGDLTLKNLPALRQWPARLHVAGHLNISGPFSGSELPPNLRVDGDLNISDWSQLARLPPDIQVGRSIRIVGCSEFSEVPAGLHVRRELLISGSGLLTTLPADLQVDGNLSIVDCTSFMFLPPTLQVGGRRISIEGRCPQLRSLPADWLRGLRRLPNGARREIFLGGIVGLTREAFVQLRELNPANLDIEPFRSPECYPSVEYRAPHKITIRRPPGPNVPEDPSLPDSDVLAQTQAQYAGHGPEKFVSPPEVCFEGEIGIDAGGLRKELLQLLFNDCVTPARGLFVASEDETEGGCFNVGPLKDELGQTTLRFVGRIVAMAYDFGQPLPFRLASSVIAGARWNSQRLETASLEQLLAIYKTFDSGSAKNLEMMTAQNADPKLYYGLYFTDLAGQTLCEGGDELEVTCDNVNEYARLFAISALKPILPALQEFWTGIREVLTSGQPAAFEELLAADTQDKLCGTSVLDLADWEQNTSVEPENSPMKQTFFEALKELRSAEHPDTVANQRKLLKFVTGCPVAPCGGFANLRKGNAPSRFALRIGAEGHRLPVAHVCFNTLDLPTTPVGTLVKKLLTSIYEGGEEFHLV